MKKDLSERELSEEEAHDRSKWRRLIRLHRPHIKVGKDAEKEGGLGLGIVLCR